MTSNGAKNKRALITGITGQDGAYLAQHLIRDKGYQVVGLVRRTSDDMPERRLRLPELQEYLQGGELELALGDVTDLHSLVSVLAKYGPDEVYNLAAQSHVGKSFGIPEATIAANLNGVLNILKAVQMTNAKARIYQASTSEMFGSAAVTHIPQDEQTPFHPISPYGIAKTGAHHAIAAARNRDKDPLPACSGILFNHESPIRGECFVTRKIAMAAARWAHHALRAPLRLGNLTALRDWGFAGDYVRAMWLILNQSVDAPQELQDYVVASGEKHLVKHFLVEAFKAAGNITGKEPHLQWQGEGEHERLLIDDKVVMAVDPGLYRPNELYQLRGDPTKIRKELGWRPTIKFKDLVEMMVRADVHRLAKERLA